MITPIGNHKRGYLGHGIDGVGTSEVVVGIAATTIAASAAGDVWVQQLAALKSDLNMGVYLQATGAVTVEYTLMNAGIAGNPDPAISDSATWTPPVALVPGAITHVESIFTCMRLTFQEPGLVMMGVS